MPTLSKQISPREQLAVEWSLTTDGWQKTAVVEDMVRGAGSIPQSFVRGSCVQMGMALWEVDTAILALASCGYVRNEGTHLVWQEPDQVTLERECPACGHVED